MLSTFSFTSNLLENEDKFHRFDDLTFAYKLAARFGALTLASTLASAVCYPFDTIKRRLQLEGSPGYQNSEIYNEFRYANKMMKEEGFRSFYRGFTVGTLCRLPVCIIQYTVYQNYKKAFSGQQ